MRTILDAEKLLTAAWPVIIDECRAVLGGELHYQAVAYHCLRNAGVPRNQIGMNVKQWITDPISELFIANNLRKHADFQGGFEPIPDLVLFTPDINGDWRRRNFEASTKQMLLAIEIKASERAMSRLSGREIRNDILKLSAHRDEVLHRGGQMRPVMMVIDTAPLPQERMRESAIEEARSTAAEAGVRLMYVSPVEHFDSV